MNGVTYSRRAVRFVLWQLVAGVLVFAALFAIPISPLVEQRASGDGTIGTQAFVLQQMAHLADETARGAPAPADVRDMSALVRRAWANETRIAAGVDPATSRSLARELAIFADAAMRRVNGISNARLRGRMFDVLLDLTRTLATAERQHFARIEERNRLASTLIACAVAALVLLLFSGWYSLVKSSRDEQLLRERVADADEDDVQLARMEELYLIVASAGTEGSTQVERALAFASRSLAFEWAATVEWIDGEEAKVSAVLGDEATSSPGDCKLEKAIALEASRVGRPLTFRIDRLPVNLATLARASRPFAWRHCAVYSFPGDFRDDVPHCALFLGTRVPRSESLSDADRQLLRLVGTLVSSSSRNARNQKRLGDLANRDPLTGLPNLRFLNDRLDETIAASKRAGRSFAVLYVDLDGFKHVNDASGHAVGDEVLRLAAVRMTKVLRQQETVARIGGDEFVVLQTTADSASDAAEVARRLIERLSRPFVVDGVKYAIGGSVGIAMYPEHGLTGADLLNHADLALYTSKRLGKGCANFYVPTPPRHGESVA